MSNSRVNIYSYTAASNPYFVKSLAHKYGYEYQKDQTLASVLQQLVSYEGEPVLMEIIENSPDKDLFMEYFEKKFAKKEEDKKVAQPNELATYMNFTGQLAAVQQLQENKKITTETSLMVLAGAVLIAFAILTTKK
jgi:pyrroloquinoline quinone (PQQ) biosynthesis protein C